jgi:hypothetical protein
MVDHSPLRRVPSLRLPGRRLLGTPCPLKAGGSALASVFPRRRTFHASRRHGRTRRARVSRRAWRWLTVRRSFAGVRRASAGLPTARHVPHVPRERAANGRVSAAVRRSSPRPSRRRRAVVRGAGLYAHFADEAPEPARRPSRDAARCRAFPESRRRGWTRQRRRSRSAWRALTARRRIAGLG